MTRRSFLAFMHVSVAGWILLAIAVVSLSPISSAHPIPIGPATPAGAAGCAAVCATHPDGVGTLIDHNHGGLTEPRGAPSTAAAVSMTPGSLASAHPSAARAAGYSGSHYWFGSQYIGTNYTKTQTVQIVYASIETPAGSPQSGDEYLNLVSAFDSLGYYDQIGLDALYTSGGGTPDQFGIFYEQGTYSSTYGCGGAGTWAYNQAYLGENQWYTFLLYLTSSNLVFKVYYGYDNFNSTPIWTKSLTDTASTFEIDNGFTGCHGEGTPHVTWFDYTLYQEVHTLSSSNPWGYPLYNMWFDRPNVAWWGGSTWTVTGQDSSSWNIMCAPVGSCPTPPHGYAATIFSRDVIVTNSAVWFDWTYAGFVIGNPGSYTESGLEAHMGTTCSTTSCTVSISCTAPSPISLTVTSTFTSTFTGSTSDSYGQASSASTSTGATFANCTMKLTTTSPSEYTQFEWFTTIT